MNCGSPLPEDAVIVEYRVGTCHDIVSKLVYYEAKYWMPDGTVRITHATGPVPLISHRKDTMIGGVLFPALIAAGLAIASSRSHSKAPVSSTTTMPGDGFEVSTKLNS